MNVNPLQAHNVRVYRSEVPPEVHNTADARRLKEACQQFEAILWAQIWKQMRATSRRIGGRDEDDRPWKQLEDLSVEMAAEDLSKIGGTGLWKVLYDQMIINLAGGIMEKNAGEFEN